MAQPMSAPQMKKDRRVPLPQKIGMTVDEREDFIIFLTRMFPDLPFECKAFSDGSVGLELEVNEDGAVKWTTIKRPEDYLGSHASEVNFNDMLGHIFAISDIDAIIYQRMVKIMRWTNDSQANS